MLKKSAFAIIAALSVAAPFAGSTVAQAQSGVKLECWHDGNTKHFRPECPEEYRVPQRSQEQIDTLPPNRSRFNPENLFEQMMLDSGGSGGGGGGGR